jgi:hypothetical protein
MSWIKQHSDILTHQKLYRLAALLDKNRFEALGYISGLWHFTALNSWQHGDLSAFIDSIEPMLEWRGEPGKLIAAFQDSGLMDKTKVHDWCEIQAEYIRLKSRTCIAKSDKCPTKSDKSRQNIGLEKIREDKRRVETTPTAMPKPAAPAFVLPDWVDPTAWADYVAMRVKIRKPMTDRAKSLAIGDLEKLRAQGHDPKLVLEASILNSWAGVFPLKPGQMQASRPKAPPKPMTAREKAISEGRWDGMTPEQREALIEAEA